MGSGVRVRIRIVPLAENAQGLYQPVALRCVQAQRLISIPDLVCQLLIIQTTYAADRGASLLARYLRINERSQPRARFVVLRHARLPVAEATKDEWTLASRASVTWETEPQLSRRPIVAVGPRSPMMHSIMLCANYHQVCSAARTSI
ncbi:hypothetical protein BST27_01870 [Mycobacterium intermedium]|uniref:Uncharacterized protein n=1 Tax=Mycobacterium intermedium TaxID=28445 RepID=A0A1E3SKJ5_MYCIE|nr:hypothetical protein BHQ20_04020 [Mycobacterium intermedium]ORB10344.1 hypothetical protein BST27_01870 [Mycobacterium intermedium]